MSLHFQAVSLVDFPSYPNAIAWSNENFVAVASGLLVTILNPAIPCESRGVITIPTSKPFPIGVIDRKDLLSDCLLPTSLDRNANPHVRSISWSPVGLAPNSGCLLAVCTTQGCVKIYRMPFCELSKECIEVVDISEKLYAYLANEGFEKLTSEDHQNQATEDQYPDDVPISIWAKSIRTRKNASTETNNSNDCRKSIIPYVALSKLKPRALKTVRDNEHSLISAELYASRNALLSSLVVAWSPIVHVSTEVGGSVIKSPTECSILAVGTKSGKITLWRVDKPRSYSITKTMESVDALLIGIMQAHSSFVTSISWSRSDHDASKPQLILASGSSDGSVKIWQAYGVDLLESSEVCHNPFSLMKETSTVDYVPVSVLTLTMTTEDPPMLLLAIGRGSGSIETWSCDVSTRKFDKVENYEAHHQIVTGLAWGFNGNCLYSCSQDNSLRSWTLHGNTLRKASIPSNTPNVKFTSDIPKLFHSCYGVAFSPGNLVLAVARTFDTELLNPMYEQGAIKACVEFLWVGGQQLHDMSDIHAEFEIHVLRGFPERELVHWESNILWSLNHYECPAEPLVVWDVVVALLAFKKSVPKYVRHILMKWLQTICRESSQGSTSILAEVCKTVSMFSLRQLNLINIISRHVILEERKAYNFNAGHSDVEEMVSAEELNLWKELIENCETEVRLRLVGCSFSAARSTLSRSSAKDHGQVFWIPSGIAQMEQWVVLNNGCGNDNVKVLGKAIKKFKKSRRQSMSEYVLKEQCSLCNTLVPFESAEVALCERDEESSQTGERMRHKRPRCAVSMRVCPATSDPATSVWYCMSCQRRSLNLAPKAFFSMNKRPLDFESFTESLSPGDWTVRPFCPFCGILLQRFLPPFLLSASAV